MNERPSNKLILQFERDMTETMREFSKWARTVGEKFKPAFNAFGEAMLNISMGLLDQIVSMYLIIGNYDGLLDLMSDEAYEQYARRVVAHYNLTHPRRKKSWRRLNRHERREAARLWAQDILRRG